MINTCNDKKYGDMVNEMIKKQRFSIRKFKTGVGSVLLATVIFGVPMFTDQTQMSSSIVFADTIDKSSLKQSDWTREDAALITQYYLQEGATGLTQKRVEDLIDWYNGSAKIKTLIPNYSINYSYFNDVLKGDMANPTSFNDTFINRVISAYSTRAIDSFKTEIDKKIDELKKSPNADKYSNIINQLEDMKNGITADKIMNDSAGLAKQLNDLISEEALNKALNNDSSKSGAKAAIDEALAKKKEEIAKSTLTDEEKVAANKEADDAAKAAKTAIDEASDAQGVDTAKTQGVSAINNVSTASATKTEAKAAIDQAAADKNAAIEASGLTPEEKDAAKADVKRLADEAKKAIDAATDAQGVEAAKNKGVSDIDNVSTASASKTEAKAAIDKAAADKNAAIEASGLTPEEKAAANADVKRLATDAKSAIDQAKDAQGVETAKTKGVSDINNVSTESASKADVEVAKFKSDNADVLAKTPETVTVADKGAVEKALADYAKLSPAAQAKLTSEKTKLEAMKVKLKSLRGNHVNLSTNTNQNVEKGNKILPKAGLTDPQYVGVLGFMMSSLGSFFALKRKKEEN